MMATLCVDFKTPVTKTTGGLIVLPRNHCLVRRYARKKEHKQRIGRSACDQCSYCTELCPRYLLGHPIQPHIAMRSLGFSGPSPAMVVGTLFCCECNLCSLWSCPEDLDPRSACIDSKQLVRQAGLKWTPVPVKAHPLMNDRRTPVKRLMKRLDLDQFVNKGPLKEGTVETSKVVLPLKQHAGPPAEPVVRAGDKVKAGDPVAVPREGNLGACIHASIEGRVVSVNESIVIEK